MKNTAIRKTNPLPEQKVKTWPYPHVTRKGWLGRWVCEHDFKCVLLSNEPPSLRIIVCQKCGEDRLVRGLPVVTIPAPRMPEVK